MLILRLRFQDEIERIVNVAANDAYDDVAQILVRVMMGDELFNLLLSVALFLVIDHVLDAIPIIPISDNASSVVSGRKDGSTLGPIAALMVVSKSTDFLLVAGKRSTAENHLLECAGHQGDQRRTRALISDNMDKNTIIPIFDDGIIAGGFHFIQEIAKLFVERLGTLIVNKQLGHEQAPIQHATRLRTLQADATPSCALHEPLVEA